MGDFSLMGEFLIIDDSWIMGDFSIMSEGDRHTNKHTDTSISWWKYHEGKIIWINYKFSSSFKSNSNYIKKVCKRVIQLSPHW